MKKTLKTNYFYLMNSKQIKESEINEGATNFDGKWICNYNVSDIIEIQENNKLSIYVPSTIDVNKINDNLDNTIKSVKEKIKQDTNEYKTKGAWKCEDGSIVYEDITILTINSTMENFENQLNDFIELAENLKKELTQEGISIGINNGLMII